MSSDLSSYWRSVEEIQRLLDGVSIDSTKLNVKLPFFAQFSNNKVTRSLKIIEARMKETAKKSEQLKEVTDLLHERLSLMVLEEILQNLEFVHNMQEPEVKSRVRKNSEKHKLSLSTKAKDKLRKLGAHYVKEGSEIVEKNFDHKTYYSRKEVDDVGKGIIQSFETGIDALNATKSDLEREQQKELESLKFGESKELIRELTVRSLRVYEIIKVLKKLLEESEKAQEAGTKNPLMGLHDKAVALLADLNAYHDILSKQIQRLEDETAIRYNLSIIHDALNALSKKDTTGYQQLRELEAEYEADAKKYEDYRYTDESKEDRDVKERCEGLMRSFREAGFQFEDQLSSLRMHQDQERRRAEQENREPREIRIMTPEEGESIVTHSLHVMDTIRSAYDRYISEKEKNNSNETFGEYLERMGYLMERFADYELDLINCEEKQEEMKLTPGVRKF